LVFKKLICVFFLLVFQSAAHSQDWEWEITPYLWAAGIEGSVLAGPQGADISVEFEDLLNVLSGGALVRFEASKDRNRFFGDLVYLALEENNARDTVGGSIAADLDTLIIEAGYSRKVSDTLAWDVGVRYWDFETALTPPILPAATSSHSWADGFTGPRFTVDISSNWTWITRANIGGGGSDFALGVDLDFRRRFENGNSLAVGFRALSVEFEKASSAVPLVLDTTFLGLTLGYVFDL